ncbi:hypothetical protein PsYK624_009210 [Phanerochaete sordida]|uniref:Uncharacterized protein n=1 Tax=Phanerochaete sordida TaxID=48140 RepID=A0A9P3FYU7_9APHY|nr:hypothetical protein PsYK624_009210 [Phanerochaete sordida]
MSHLTANPFQKHYEFPRPGPLLTPPETEPEFPSQSLPSGLPSSSQPMPNGLGIELDPSSTPRGRSSPVPDLPLRKVSSLQYINTGPREARERTEKRGMRWLVVVVPPASFGQEHGHLGHTLSVGSQDRLSQGILMPLYTTMTTQLVAIAREFAFPSTSGLCLYLHTTYGGAAVTPRISDESWQPLWGHLFDPKSPALQHAQLPIGGKIEIDIDLSKARWYEAWLGMGRRDNMDVPVSVTPSRAGSPGHWRGDSKASFLDDQTETPDESLDLLNLGRHSRGPSQRHIPKKLSLLDRLENASARSAKLAPRIGSPPSPRPDARHPLALSPIVQGGSEPPSAKKDIDRFVNSWRQSATLAASPLRATGQTSLDPVNLPNGIPLDSPSSPNERAVSELDLEDFQWSVSSLGPPDYDDDLESAASWRISSVHLDRRLEGSVLLSPTTCTSFGPPDWDDDYMSYASVISRLPSPDLGARMIEDCPPTPSTATSWGPPLSYPPSPAARSVAASVDLGQRAMSTVPLTPSTATSWGPPLSWPSTPATPYHVHTPDVAQRTFDDAAAPRRYPRPPPLESEGEEQPWRNVWPYSSVATPGVEGESAGASPYRFTFPRRPASPPAEVEAAVTREVQVEAEASGSAHPSSLVWPYYTAAPVEPSTEPVAQPAEAPSQPLSLVWPYYSAAPAEAEAPAAEPQVAAAPAEQPAQPSTMSWPYYAAPPDDDAPAPAQETRHVVEEVASAPPAKAPKQSPFRFVYDAEDAAASAALEDDLPEDDTPDESVYADEEELAAPAIKKQRSLQELMDADSASEFSDEEEEEPFIRPAPAVQSWSLFGMSMDVSVATTVVVEEAVHHEEERVYVDDDYAWDEDHGVVVDGTHSRGVEGEQLSVVENMLPPVIPVSASVSYPFIHLYPAVYPHLELYPEAPGALEVKSVPEDVDDESVYESDYSDEEEEEPFIRPAPAVNQSWALFGMSMDVSVATTVVVEENVHYEEERVYVDDDFAWDEEDHKVYVDDAHVRDYEEELVVKKPATNASLSAIPAPASVSYPYFNIYPAVYPYMELYPEAPGALEAKAPAFLSPIRILPYPAMSLYSPVYPHNVQQLYPSTHAEEPRMTAKETLQAISARTSLYSPIFPYRMNFVFSVDDISVRLPVKYPALDLYRPVYPYNLEEIYPPAMASTKADPTAYPWSLYNIYGGKAVARSTTPARISPKAAAHHVDPTAYPWSVYNIYSGAPKVGSTSPARSLNKAGVRDADPTAYPWSMYNIYAGVPRVGPASPLPVRLPAAYPKIDLYPAAYPHIDIYPEVETIAHASESVVVRAEHKYPVLDIYPATYPSIELYPPPTASEMAKAPAASPSSKPTVGKVQRRPTLSHSDLHVDVFGTTFAPRRKPRHTHADLREMVMASVPAEKPAPVRRDSAPSMFEEAEPIDIIPVVSPVPAGKPFGTPTILEEDEDTPELPPSRMRTPSLSQDFDLPPSLSRSSSTRSSSSSQAGSPRRLPIPPPSSQSSATTPSPPSSLRSRVRSGTVTGRTPLPSPPSFGMPPAPTSSSSSSPTNNSPPSRVGRRLPAIPGEAPSKELPPPPPPTRSMSMRPMSIGLPSDPAAGRRASALGFNRPPPFAPLPPVPEPSGAEAPARSAPSLRTQPPPEGVAPGSQSATLPPTQPLAVGATELSRSASVPGRPLPRTRRGSVSASGLVAGLANRWDSPADATLAQFPVPPRAPLPVPNSRPVSKLDRSKYPFA